MALGATIYKVELSVADTDRHYYSSHNLTVARHPSETIERMLVRLLAFALHAHEDLVFTKGISDADEPDIWLKDLTGVIELWVEVGQPSPARIAKACGRARSVVVYCYGGHASKVWWDGVREKVDRLKNLKVICLPDAVGELAKGIERNIELQVTIQEGDLFVSVAGNQMNLTPALWREDT